VNSTLIPIWTEIETQRRTAVEWISSLTADQRLLRRSSHAWSIAQIVEHITRSEAAIIAQSIQKQRARARPLRFETRLRYTLMRIHFAVPVVKVKTPTPAIVPSENPSIEDVCRDWERIRKDWFEYLAGLQSDEHRLGIFFHPLVGALTPKMTLRFLHMHAHHHLRHVRQSLRINDRTRPA
jgi:hypothetical protein